MATIYDLFADRSQVEVSRAAVGLLEQWHAAEVGFMVACKTAKVATSKGEECLAPVRQTVKEMALKVIAMEIKMNRMEADGSAMEGVGVGRLVDNTESLKEVLQTTAERLVALEARFDSMAATELVATGAGTERSFAGVLRGRSRSRVGTPRGAKEQPIPKKTLIVLRSRSDDPNVANADSIKETLKKVVKPQEKGWQIVGMRGRRGKEVVVEAANDKEAQRIMADTDLGGSGLEAEFFPKRKPTIQLRGVPLKVDGVDFTDDLLVRALWKQNVADMSEAEFKKKCMVVRRIPWAARTAGGDGQRQMSNIVVEVAPDLRIRLLEQGRAYISWFRCQVEDFTDVLRCYRCGIIGHIGRFCRICSENEKCCRICTEKSHTQRECPNKGSPVCGSCKELKVAHNHVTGATTCEAHRRAVAGLLAVTDYGQ